MGSGKTPFKILGVVLDIMQSALAILLVALVSWKMLRVNISKSEFNFDTKCLLDGSAKDGILTGVSFCAYAIAVGVVSLVANCLLSLMKMCLGCLTAGACGIKDFFSILSDTLLAIWWGVAFALIVQRGTDANEKGFPEETARNGIIATAFGGMMSFVLDIVFTVCGLVASSAN